MPHARHGHSLPELLVTLALSGALCALLATAFIAHERLVAGATTIGAARTQARQASEMIPAIVKPASATDLAAVHDTLIEFDYPIASGIVCLPSNGSQLVLAPDTIARGEHLGGTTHSPQPGDVAHVFDAGPLIAASDDRWVSIAINSSAMVPNGCAGSPLVHPVADAGHRSRALGISWPGPTPPPPGAAVHITRRTRLYLYQSTGGRFLGVSDFDASLGRWSTVQPASGPYAGLRFSMRDSTGAGIPAGTNPGAVAALAIQLGSQTTSRVRIVGMRAGIRSESLTTLVALRNR